MDMPASGWTIGEEDLMRLVYNLISFFVAKNSQTGRFQSSC